MAAADSKDQRLRASAHNAARTTHSLGDHGLDFPSPAYCPRTAYTIRSGAPHAVYGYKSWGASRDGLSNGVACVGSRH